MPNTAEKEAGFQCSLNDQEANVKTEGASWWSKASMPQMRTFSKVGGNFHLQDPKKIILAILYNKTQEGKYFWQPLELSNPRITLKTID